MAPPANTSTPAYGARCFALTRRNLRVTEIHENLQARLVEAREHGWLGEAEGLDATIAAAEQKLASMHRATNGAAVINIGVPE